MNGTAATMVQRLVEDPAILGLGDLDLKHAACRSRLVSLLLEDRAASSLYVVDLQLGPTDDLHVIRMVERWAGVRKRQRTRRCFAVLVAEQIELRYVNIVGVICRAVPVVAMEMREVDGLLRFTQIGLR